MLRITENLDNGTAVRVRLDGNISVESYADLEKVFERYNDCAGRTIILDMAGVDYMNDEAARKLARLQGDRLRVINCSPFIATLLQSVGTEDLNP